VAEAKDKPAIKAEEEQGAGKEEWLRLRRGRPLARGPPVGSQEPKRLPRSPQSLDRWPSVPDLQNPDPELRLQPRFHPHASEPPGKPLQPIPVLDFLPGLLSQQKIQSAPNV
jgi:hypothetical protein